MRKLLGYFTYMRKKYKWFDFSSIVAIGIVVAITIFLAPMMLDLWIENDSETSEVYRLVSAITQINLNIIWGVILIAIFGIALYQIYRIYNDKSDEFEQYKKDQARTILSLYDELNYFDLQKNIKIIMERFCKYHTSVIAIQLYKYEHLPKRKNVTTKVNYVDGYVKEGNAINGIIQQYYSIDKSLYKNYSEAISSLEENSINIEALLSFILSQVEEISKKRIRNITSKDATIYALVMDAYARVSSYYPELEDIYIEDEVKVNKLERLLSEKKRFGIYRGSLLNSFYSFYYEGEEGSKKGRQYITNPIILRNERHMVLITLDSNLLGDFQEKKLEKYTVEFEKMIQETFEKVYNKERGR